MNNNYLKNIRQTIECEERKYARTPVKCYDGGAHINMRPARRKRRLRLFKCLRMAVIQ